VEWYIKILLSILFLKFDMISFGTLSNSARKVSKTVIIVRVYWDIFIYGRISLDMVGYLQIWYIMKEYIGISPDMVRYFQIW
jgi:hypothetical protein